MGCAAGSGLRGERPGQGYFATLRQRVHRQGWRRHAHPPQRVASENPMLEAIDHQVRGALTRRIADLGHAPSNQDLAASLGLTLEQLEASLQRLHDAHALLLHPHACRPWAVHPFALSPGSCWVETATRGYWANCLYCGLGMVAALKSDAVITTRLGGEGETVRYTIENGTPRESSDVFHLSTPVAEWWDNVIFACGSLRTL